MKLIKLITIITICVAIGNAQQTPADKQSKSIAITFEPRKANSAAITEPICPTPTTPTFNIATSSNSYSF